MHTWHWHTWQGLPYLTCSLLKDWQHGFFTQQFWSRSPADLVNVLQPDAEVYRVKQVHGNIVLSSSEVKQTAPSATESNPPSKEGDCPSFPDADGLLADQKNQAIWVCTADCTPVLIADEETGQVAAIHAGWRGTALGIVQKAVARMQAQGSQLNHLRVAMGPAIAGEVYQVSTMVALQVGATVVNQPVGVTAETETNAQLDPAEVPDELLNALRQLPDSPLLDDPQPGRARLDVRRVNALQLEQMGVSSDQIAIAPYCTYQNPDLFFSYRRNRQKKVQWSGIVS
ncbi:MAG: peptidoglycan editing factor PgeF [Elainellaceae cyanobacterium]